MRESEDVTPGSLGTLTDLAVGSKQITQNDIVTDQTDIFDAPSVEMSCLWGKQVTLFPLESLEQRDFTFQFPSYSGLYLMPKSLRLKGVLKVLRSTDGGTTWGALTAADKNQISLNQFYAQTMWSTMICAVNGRMVSTVSTRNYPYKALFENLLSFSKESANFHLITSGYVEDKPGHLNDFTDGSGYAVRNEWLLKSGSTNSGGGKLGFCTPLCIDFLQNSRLLLDNTPMTLNMTLGEDKFNLFKATNSSGAGGSVDYKIAFDELYIEADYVHLQDGLKVEIDNMLKSGQRARYPQIKSVVKTQTVPSGSTEFTWTNMLQGKMPYGMVVAFVKQSAHRGDITENPFHFPNLNIAELWTSINSTDYPSNHYKPAFSEGNYKYLKDFGTVVDHLCTERSPDTTCLVGHKLWKDDLNVYTFDYSADVCSGYHIHLGERGTAMLSVKFDSALTENYICVVMASFHEELQLDGERKMYSEQLAPP